MKILRLQLTVDFLVVGEKFLQPTIGKWMAEQRGNNAQGTRCNVCADLSALNEVHRMSN